MWVCLCNADGPEDFQTLDNEIFVTYHLICLCSKKLRGLTFIFFTVQIIKQNGRQRNALRLTHARWVLRCDSDLRPRGSACGTYNLVGD